MSDRAEEVGLNVPQLSEETVARLRDILPAFGAFTGGMDAADPAILNALQPAQRIDAVVPAKGQLARFNLWNRAA